VCNRSQFCNSHEVVCETLGLGKVVVLCSITLEITVEKGLEEGTVLHKSQLEM